MRIPNGNWRGYKFVSQWQQKGTWSQNAQWDYVGRGAASRLNPEAAQKLEVKVRKTQWAWSIRKNGVMTAKRRKCFCSEGVRSQLCKVQMTNGTVEKLAVWRSLIPLTELLPCEGASHTGVEAVSVDRSLEKLGLHGEQGNSCWSQDKFSFSFV